MSSASTPEILRESTVRYHESTQPPVQIEGDRIVLQPETGLLNNRHALGCLEYTCLSIVGCNPFFLYFQFPIQPNARTLWMTLTREGRQEKRACHSWNRTLGNERACLFASKGDAKSHQSFRSRTWTAIQGSPMGNKGDIRNRGNEPMNAKRRQGHKYSRDVLLLFKITQDILE